MSIWWSEDGDEDEDEGEEEKGEGVDVKPLLNARGKVPASTQSYAPSVSTDANKPSSSVLG